MHFIKKYSFVFFLSVITGLSIGQNKKDSLESCDFSCCGIDDPTPSGVMISHTHKKNQWMVSYRMMSMEMQNVLNGTTKQDKNEVFVNYLMAPDKMKMDMHMLMGMYGITNRFTVMAMLNYNVSSMSMSMLPGTSHHHAGSTEGNGTDHNMKTSGIGDMKFHFLYGILNKRTQHILVSAGISIPTGNIQLKGDSESMYPAQRFPYSMQMGSGSFDLLPCLNYLFQKRKFTFSSQVSSVIRTGFNKVGYKLGNELTLNTWFGYQWKKFLSSTLRVEGNLCGQIKKNYPTLYYFYEPSANPNNYGGQRATVFIGSSFHFTRGCLKKSKIGIEYGLPFYQNLNGPQMALKSSLFASMSVSF